LLFAFIVTPLVARMDSRPASVLFVFAARQGRLLLATISRLILFP
jgi:hypothetical protein